MTHEYVIGLRGRIEPVGDQTAPATAVGWAADAILAVGSNANVRAISRGDSTFLDLQGCHVTPLPDDIEAAIGAMRSEGGTADPQHDVGSRLVSEGMLPADSVIETGSPADLAFWDDDGELLAITRDGQFTRGDPKHGPFAALPGGRLKRD
jgi:hypothetical protein